MPRASATRCAWNFAESGEMSGSRPLADAVTSSAGTSASGASLFAWRRSPPARVTSSRSFWLVGPRFEPLEDAAS